ncbi:MAG: hypothetical protein ACP5HL_00335 [Minisyncoccia bacterium]
MKKLFILLSILIISTLGYLIYHKFYQNYGVLIIETNPLKTTIELKSDFIQNAFNIQNGFLKIKLKPGQYDLIISNPSYYKETKTVNIKSGEITQLEPINLLPQNWINNNIVNNANIDFFIPNSQNNLFLYLSLVNKKYEWHLFNRANKEDIKIYQSDNLPLRIFFTDDKRLLIQTKTLEWKILFTEKNLINNANMGVNLINIFLDAFKKQQNIPKDFKIIEVLPYKDNTVIFNTSDGIYLFNYITLNVNKIFDEPVQGLIIDGDNIYFIQKNGLLTKENISNNNFENISLFKFYNKNEDYNKIKLFKNKSDDFVIITPSTNYLLLADAEEKVPRKLDFSFDKVAFNSNKKIILFFNSSNKTTILYDINQNQEKILSIEADDLPHWFLAENYLLFKVKNSLFLYDLNKNLQYSIKDDIKNGIYYYDEKLNYIFYLDNEGIEMISY